MYKLLDTKTGKQLPRLYKMLKTASRAANKLDMEYGAIRYSVAQHIERMPESMRKEGIEEFFRMPF
jgi:hypothetical protein